MGDPLAGSVSTRMDKPTTLRYALSRQIAEANQDLETIDYKINHFHTK